MIITGNKNKETMQTQQQRPTPADVMITFSVSLLAFLCKTANKGTKPVVVAHLTTSLTRMCRTSSSMYGRTAQPAAAANRAETHILLALFLSTCFVVASEHATCIT
jgi:hypothetical protein